MLTKPHSPKKISRIKSPKTFTYEQIKMMLKQNPFEISNDEDLHLNQILSQEKQNKSKQPHQSLVKRAVPNSLPKLQEKNITKNEEEVIKPVAPERQRRQQMHCYVDQTREILLTQIKIDRKRKEIKRIKQQQKTEKAIIENEVSKIAETNNQYEMTANGIKAQLTRARSEMERALLEKQEIQRILKHKQSSVAKIRAEITKNEDIVFASRNYAEFLKSLAPDDQNPLVYFKNPETLMKEMDQLEAENLFLIKKCQELEQEKDRAVEMIKEHLEEAEKEKMMMDEASRHVKQIDAIHFDTSQLSSDTDDVEKERVYLAKIVQSSYMKCFSNKAEMTPIMMLEKIENCLEKLYIQLEDVPLSFVLEEQSKIDKQRREELRILKQQHDNLEQKKKRDAAIARAKKPVQKKMGRRLNARMLPLVRNRKEHDDKKMQDEKLQEEFLFGPIYN